VLARQTLAEIAHARARRNRWTAAALWAIALLLGWLIYLLVTAPA
jgi:ubiquinone biosynthesis protein